MSNHGTGEKKAQGRTGSNSGIYEEKAASGDEIEAAAIEEAAPLRTPRFSAHQVSGHDPTNSASACNAPTPQGAASLSSSTALAVTGIMYY